MGHSLLNTQRSNMCDEDVAALVVDNGSGMCKAGFAGMMLPGQCSLPLWDAPDIRV